MAADWYPMVHVADDRLPAPPRAASDATVVGSAAKRTRNQRAAAEVLVPDAPCRPVLVRAVITGAARMPRAALEISRPDGSVVGHVALVNTSAAFDPHQRFWLVGDATPGSWVALVSEGRRQVILPGGRLRSGPAAEQEWSPIACRMLGWQRPVLGADAPAGWHAVFADRLGSIDSPAFARAVARFRTAAVTVPALFFLVCFPYLFFIRPAVHAGVPAPVLLALPVVGGGLMGLWAAMCRRDLVDQAELVEAGARRWGKEICFTQSYWAGMRKPATAWDGPLPRAAT